MAEVHSRDCPTWALDLSVLRLVRQWHAQACRGDHYVYHICLPSRAIFISQQEDYRYSKSASQVGCKFNPPSFCICHEWWGQSTRSSDVIL
jgi:hypothetical protein